MYRLIGYRYVDMEAKSRNDSDIQGYSCWFTMEENDENFTGRSACKVFFPTDKYPEFSGKIIYEGVFTAQQGFDIIDLGQVGEASEVYLNGKYLGARINAPYKFSMQEALTEGENKIRIEVTSGLGHRRRDWLSSYMQISPSGLLGDVYLCKYNKWERLSY